MLTGDHSLHRKVVHTVSDNASNMCRAFELLRLKAMDDVDDEDDAAGADDMLSDGQLLKDLHENDGNEVSQVIVRHFHHFTTLLVTILRTKYLPPAAIKTKGPTKCRTLQVVEFIMA